jgi:hypothetical protein
MIRVIIGDSERGIDKAQISWLREQILPRRNDGMPVCVKVLIKTDSLNIQLTTPGCSGGASGGRAPNSEERRILQLWERCGMDRDDFEIAELNAFLNDIKSF